MANNTTIRVSKEVKKELEKLKNVYDLANNGDVINFLLKKNNSVEALESRLLQINLLSNQK